MLSNESYKTAQLALEVLEANIDDHPEVTERQIEETIKELDRVARIEEKHRDIEAIKKQIRLVRRKMKTLEEAAENAMTEIIILIEQTESMIDRTEYEIEKESR